MKRAFLVLAAMLLGACAARGQSFHIAGQNNSTSATATTVTVTTSANDLIVLFCREGANNSSTMSVTDSASQSGWTQTASGYSSPNTSGRMAMFWRANSAALTTATCTWSGSLSTTVTAIVFDISSAALSSPEDSSVNSNSASSVTSLTSGSLTCSNANDINIYAVGTSGNVSSFVNGTGYTIPTNGSNVRAGMQYEVVSTTQSGVTTSISWTGSQAVASVFACFKGSGAAPAQAHGLLMRGVG